MKHEFLRAIELQSQWQRWSEKGVGAQVWKEFMGYEHGAFRTQAPDDGSPVGGAVREAVVHELSRKGLGHVSTFRGFRNAPSARRMDLDHLVTHDRPHSDGRYITEIERDSFEEPLRVGDCYYVGPEFCRLVEHARESLPDATFDPRLLPSRYGFVYFETPMCLPKTRGHQEMVELAKLPGDYRMHARAFGWRPVVGKRPGEGMDKARPMIQFTIYQDGSNAASAGPGSLGHLARDGYWPLAFFAMTEGEVLSVRMKEFEGIAESQQDASTYILDADEVWRHEIRLVYTLLLLANQRVAAIKKHNLDRAARRRQQKERPEAPADHIKVITLRRYEERAKGVEPSAVDWQVQWDVRGHWRWQWYPSLGYHQSIWIEGYTKGPADKPFKADQRRLFAVVR